ncbi:unnamed protein product [Bursaphelenchus okinawaensis]|uniref:HOOK N-terminal domain-containing protein n=1 Tax=Bursaphelenchus okinawaensis TaxID=465554 RepID=A0A811L652_9BILA|nr:unnamed protein product [Bursaphelenchus okinawaensis]CAG9120104.1 unnamed protein product [Bursaphelenchus okinawaensis]
MNEDQFWDSALGRWIRSCTSQTNPVILEKVWRQSQHVGGLIQYEELCDGYFVNVFLELIYPECTVCHLIKYTNRPYSNRLSLLRNFLSNLIQFFKRHEKIPLTLPDVINVSQNSSPERSGHDIQKLLGLLIVATFHTTHKSTTVDQLQQLIANNEQHIKEELETIFNRQEPVIDLNTNPPVIASIAEERHSTTFQLISKMLEDTESDEGSSNSGEFQKCDKTPTIDEYEEKLMDLGHKIKMLEGDKQVLSEELESMDADHSELIKEHKELNKANEKLMETIRDLKDKCQGIPDMEHKLDKAKTVEKDNEKLKAENQRLKMFETENTELKHKINKLQTTIKKHEGVLNGYRKIKPSATALEEALQKKNDKFAEKLKELESEKEEIQVENRNLRHKIEMLNHKIDQMRPSADESFVTAPNISLCDELNDSRRDEEIRELEERNISFEETIKKTREDLEEYERRNKQLKAEIRNIEDQLNRKNNDVEIKEKAILVEINNYKNNIQSKDQKISDQLRLIEEKDQLITKLSNSEVALKSEVKNLERIRKEKEHIESVIQSKNNEIDHTRAEIEDIKDELDRLKKQHSKCDRSKKAVQEELEGLKIQLEASDEQNRQLRTSMSSSKLAQSRLQKMETELLKRDVENEELKSQLKALNEEHQSENKKLQQLQADLTKEKSRLKCVVGQLRAVCSTCSIKEDHIDDNELIEKVGDMLIKGHTNQFKETLALTQQRRAQTEELDVIKKNIINLEKKGADLGNPEKDYVTVIQELDSTKERLKGAQRRETDYIEQIKNIKNAKEDILKQNVEIKKNMSTVTATLVAKEEENRKLTEHLKASERHINKLQMELSDVKSNRDAIQAEYNRLNELYNSVTADFERANCEKNELKRRLGKKDDLIEEKAKMEFYTERTVLEERLKQTNRDLCLKNERLLLCEADVKKLTTELEETKADYTILLRQKNKNDEMLNSIRLSEADHRNKVTLLTGHVKQLKEVINDKNSEIFDIKKQLDHLMNCHSDVYVLSRHGLDDRLNDASQYKRATDSRIKECNNNDNKQKTNLMNRAAKAFLKPKNPRRSKPIEKNSGSNTEDSSIYSADESTLPPLPEPRLEKYRESVQVTPTCSSSDRASGSSPDYDQVQYYSIPTKRPEHSYPMIRSPPPPLAPSSFSRMRNSRISSSVRYPPAYKSHPSLGSIPVTRDDDSLNFSSNGYSTPVGSPLRSRPPPPPYRGRAVGSSPLSKTTFNPLDTSTPKSAERMFNRPVGEGENRLVVRSPEERESKAQSFYDNHDMNNVTKQNELWVGYGCL